MISQIRQILAITKESSLFEEMEAFEKSIDDKFAEVEDLLEIDVRSAEEITLQNYMSKVESFRQTAVRAFALAACFLEHAKSPYFALGVGTEFERKSKQYQLIAPFTGLNIRLEGLVKSIDSKVNLCKVFLRVDNEGMRSHNVPG